MKAELRDPAPLIATTDDPDLKPIKVIRQKDLVEFWGVPAPTLRRWAAVGYLEIVRLGPDGGVTCYTVDSIKRAYERGRR